MERDYGAEIDALRGELDGIKELLTKLSAKKEANEEKSDSSMPSNVGEKVGHVHKMKNMHPDENVMKLMSDCENKCGEENLTGCITYLGVFASGGHQSSWVSKDRDADSLLKLAENGSAERVLACIGSQTKLNILSALLKKNMTVSELVEALNLGSTGQAYHHLRTLITADFVREDEHSKGSYEIVPHRVSGIIMILAGISDLLDERYS
ncbi:MAG: ArsR family transcriptional regulator, partial [Eubacteriales bacterium]